jgi:hypothetical protein
MAWWAVPESCDLADILKTGIVGRVEKDAGDCCATKETVD